MVLYGMLATASGSDWTSSRVMSRVPPPLFTELHTTSIAFSCASASQRRWAWQMEKRGAPGNWELPPDLLNNASLMPKCVALTKVVETRTT